MSEDMARFLGKFKFDPRRRGWYGVERERFLLRNGRPTPRAQDFLRDMRDPQWTYELSACQVEDRTTPSASSEGLRMHLLLNDGRGKRIASYLKLDFAAVEVAPEDMCLDTYPDPRYDAIRARLPEHVLRAACRVAGTHIQFGAGSLEEAIEMHDALVPFAHDLAHLGDHSRGERLALYRTMATHADPVPYGSPERLFELARAEGFEENPRNCWHLIRINPHGTVELRMFGVTEEVDEVVGWKEHVQAMLGVPA